MPPRARITPWRARRRDLDCMDDFDVPVPQTVRIYEYSKNVRRLKTRIIELERELLATKTEHKYAVSLLERWEMQASSDNN